MFFVIGALTLAYGFYSVDVFGDRPMTQEEKKSFFCGAVFLLGGFAIRIRLVKVDPLLKRLSLQTIDWRLWNWSPRKMKFSDVSCVIVGEEHCPQKAPGYRDFWLATTDEELIYLGRGSEGDLETTALPFARSLGSVMGVPAVTLTQWKGPRRKEILEEAREFIDVSEIVQETQQPKSRIPFRPKVLLAAFLFPFVLGFLVSSFCTLWSLREADARVYAPGRSPAQSEFLRQHKDLIPQFYLSEVVEGEGFQAKRTFYGYFGGTLSLIHDGKAWLIEGAVERVFFIGFIPLFASFILLGLSLLTRKRFPLWLNAMAGSGLAYSFFFLANWEFLKV